MLLVVGSLISAGSFSESEAGESPPPMVGNENPLITQQA